METNQGGDLLVQTFKGIDARVPVKKVYASRGKYVRAEPVSVLYAEGRVAHVGEYPDLERQMCDFAADGLAHGKSPDRLDALVWAITELMLTDKARPHPPAGCEPVPEAHRDPGAKRKCAARISERGPYGGMRRFGSSPNARPQPTSESPAHARAQRPPRLACPHPRPARTRTSPPWGRG